MSADAALLCASFAVFGCRRTRAAAAACIPLDFPVLACFMNHQAAAVAVAVAVAAQSSSTMANSTHIVVGVVLAA